jgi:hypothetical protein
MKKIEIRNTFNLPKSRNRRQGKMKKKKSQKLSREKRFQRIHVPENSVHQMHSKSGGGCREKKLGTQIERS